ncbi:MarR family winged helix-turn-helix transcriptional regulator [Sinorhizobium fredii]|uniref:MarR family winged helix-turn-helix transcriptional regulator n=1 Tax=Rhizobium fredii TaxID=380 RepID=UPI001FCB7BA8|nr:MarR family transcriptional regulator [Sinorhizobium fredii]
MLDPGIFEGLAGIRLAMRRFLSFSEAVLSEAGVTTQQYQAMLVIKVAPQSRVKVRELAEEMLMQHNGAVQLIDRLEAAGLALREPSVYDKRTVLVGLTPNGEKVLEALARRHLGAMLENEPLLVESLSRLRKLAKMG